MFGSEEVWGISIGSLDLRAVKMTQNADQVLVLEAEIIPYLSGEAGEGMDKDLKIRQALQMLVEKHKLKGQKVAIAVPGNAVFSKFITLPPVERKRVPEIVKYESRQQIPFPIEEVIWDYQPVKAEPLPGEEIEVALFAIRREIVQGTLAECLSAGLLPEVVQTAPLAFCNFLQYDQPTEEPVVVLDVARDGTELLIIDGERTWPRSIAVGSQDLTVALQKKFQIPLEKAEELRVQASKAKQADRLFSVMKPVLQNLAGQVQRTLGFYKSQHPEARFNRVVLAGECFQIPGVEAFFKETLRYDFVHLGLPKRLEADDGIPQADFAARAPELAVPFGLGLQALGMARMRVNLVPPEHVQQRKQQAKRPWVAVSVLLLGSAMGMDYFQAIKERDALTAAQGAVVAKIADITAKGAALDKARTLPQPILGQLEKLPGLLLDRETGLPPRIFSDVLHEVVQVVPVHTIWMDGLALQPMQAKDLGAALTPPAWCKDKDGKLRKDLWVLKVAFDGQRIFDGSEEEMNKAVKEQFIDKLQKVPYFSECKTSWITEAKSREEADGSSKWTFTAEWLVDPEAYLKRLFPPPSGDETPAP